MWDSREEAALGDRQFETEAALEDVGVLESSGRGVVKTRWQARDQGGGPAHRSVQPALTGGVLLRVPSADADKWEGVQKRVKEVSLKVVNFSVADGVGRRRGERHGLTAAAWRARSQTATVKQIAL